MRHIRRYDDQVAGGRRPDLIAGQDVRRPGQDVVQLTRASVAMRVRTERAVAQFGPMRRRSRNGIFRSGGVVA